MNKSDIFWQTYLNLENSLVDLGKYVLISDVSNSDPSLMFFLHI